MKTFKQLKKELDKNKVTGFYVFTGDEKEVMRKYIKRINPHARTVDSVQQLWAQLSNKGLFKRGGTYVLYNNKEIQEMEVKTILGKLKYDNLILVFDTIDRRKKFFKDVDKYTTEFKKFDDNQLIQYITKQNPAISNEIAFIIARCCNNDIGRIEIELDKLSFVNSDINMDIISDLITPQAEDQIFEMIDGVAIKDKEKTFGIYYDLLELKESPIKIISLLYMKFKQLFLIQNYYNLPDGEIMNKTGLNYGQIKFTKKLMGKFATNDLLRILQDIQKVEVGVKTGKIDMHMGTEDLLLKIIK